MSFETQSDSFQYLINKEKTISQLEKLGNFWTGSDIKIEKPVVVEPDKYSYLENKIILNKKDLPPVDITRETLSTLEYSMRSFYAQTGIEIMFHHAEMTDAMIKDLADGKNAPVPVSIKNYGQRAVEVSGDVLRFFWRGKPLHGQELLNTLKSGEFSVEGVEGEDWFLWNYEAEYKPKGQGGILWDLEENRRMTTKDKDAEKSLCIGVRLKPEKLYIPNADEPVKRDSSKKIRDNLDTYLRPIPDGMKLDFEIGETPHIKVGKNIIAAIGTTAEKGQKHIYSPLIDSGSNWPIRTETVGGLDVIDIYLYKK